MSYIDELSEKLFQVLPADSHKQIASNLGLKIKVVSNAITKIRKDPKRFGFTVGHAVHTVNERNSGKFFAILLEKDDGITISEGSKGHLFRGNGELCRIVASSCRNNSIAFRFVALNTQSRSVKRGILDFSKLLVRVAEDADVLAERMKEEVA